MDAAAVTGFLRYFDNVRERTLRVAKVIPRERLEWSYAGGKFTFGDILRHLGGIERHMFAENAMLRPSRYPGHGRELADGYDEVFAYLARMHAEAGAIFASLAPADWLRACTTPGGTQITVWKWLRSMAEHEAHHRGQIYVYLSMLGVPAPPLYGLTEEEVRARSIEPGAPGGRAT